MQNFGILTIIKIVFYILIKILVDKKTYLIKILDQLQPVRNVAKGLKIFVEGWKLEDNIIDTLMEALQWAIHNAKSELDKAKMRKWLVAMQKIKEIELKSNEQDEKILAELDKMLENF